MYLFVFLDNCKKTAVVFEDAISMLEFINCQSVQGQVQLLCIHQLSEYMQGQVK